MYWFCLGSCFRVLVSGCLDLGYSWCSVFGSGFLCPWNGRVLVLGSGGLRSGFLDLGSWIWNLGSGLIFLGSGFWAVCSWFWVLGCLFLFLGSPPFERVKRGCGSLLFKKEESGGEGSLLFKRGKRVRRIIRGGCDPCPLKGVKGLTPLRLPTPYHDLLRPTTPPH